MSAEKIRSLLSVYKTGVDRETLLEETGALLWLTIADAGFPSVRMASLIVWPEKARHSATPLDAEGTI